MYLHCATHTHSLILASLTCLLRNVSAFTAQDVLTRSLKAELIIPLTEFARLFPNASHSAVAKHVSSLLLIGDDWREEENCRTQFFAFLSGLRTFKRLYYSFCVMCEKRERDLYLLSTPSPRDRIREQSCSTVPQRGQRFPGHLFTARTLQPESPCENERGGTDESSKEGMTPLIPSCLLRHPPGGKFNKVHIPRATEERDENTWKEGWRDGEMERCREVEMEGWQEWLTLLPVSSLTFRTTAEHWTWGGRMKHWCHTHPYKHTHKQTSDNADTKTVCAPIHLKKQKQSTDTRTHKFTHIYLGSASIPVKLVCGLCANFKNGIWKICLWFSREWALFIKVQESKSHGISNRLRHAHEHRQGERESGPGDCDLEGGFGECVCGRGSAG